MRLLYVIKSLQKGGITTGLVSRLNYLAENTNYEIHIVSEFENDSILQSKFNKTIKFHKLPIQSLISKKRIPIVGYFNLIKEVKIEYQKFINYLSPDIITSFNYGYNKEIVPYLQTKAKKIIEFRGSYQSKSLLKNKIDFIDNFKKKEEILHNKFDIGVMLTNEDLRDRNYLKIKNYVIYNEIRIPKEVAPFSGRRNIILGVGTLTHNKNFIDLIRAVSIIKEDLKDWVVHIYGEGVQRTFLEAKIKEYKLEKIIELKEFGVNMDEIYNDAKILVSTSYSEGMPRNLLEAKKFKIPIVSYDCPCGPKEIIQNGVNGVLINYEINELASALRELISNPQRLKDFSDNAYANISEFDYNFIMPKWVEFYNTIFNDQKAS